MPTVKGDSMRGLAIFISDIRNCKSKEAEVKRINKELANIRSNFRGDKTLDGYQKKKYVCKLLFIFLLGHDIDFGHMEAVNLLSSNKYTEKQIGYLFISVLVGANNELMKLVIQAIKNDLHARNPVHVCLALQCVANIGSREMAEGLGNEIPKVLVSGDTIDSVKQSAALTLLKLIRTSPDVIQMGEWASRVVHLLNDQHMGVVTAAVSLIETLVKKHPDEYKGCVQLAVSRLSRIVTSSYTDLQDYTYYFVPAPWLSVKLLRLLQNYPPPEDPSIRTRLTDCLETILNKAQEPPKSKKVQHSNAKNAVLFEAIYLIIHMDSDPNLLVRACNQLGQFLQHRETNLRYLALESMCLLATSEFSHEAVKKHLETVILALKTERDVSVRQRAVDLLYAMCDRTNAEEIVGEMLSYLETADYSIREEMVLKVAILAEKYAVDYTWYVDIILNLIRIAGDFVSEEVWYRVIQIVINRDDVQGYAAKTVFEVTPEGDGVNYVSDVDEPPEKRKKLSPSTVSRRSRREVNLTAIMPRLCVVCGNGKRSKRKKRGRSWVHDNLVQTEKLDSGKLLQAATEREDENVLVHIRGVDCVAKQVSYHSSCFREYTRPRRGYLKFMALQAPACHENMVKVGGYILGEFGNLIAGDPRSSPSVQLELLHSKFHLCSAATRGLLLSSYVKFANLFPEIKPQIQEVFAGNNQSQNADVEIQQRAIEYLRLTSVASTDVLATVLEEMPPFPERESSILAKLKKKKPESKEGGEVRPSQAAKMPAAQINNVPLPTTEPEKKAPEQQAADLLGLSTPATNPTPPSANSVLIDVFEATQAAGETFKQNGIHAVDADEGFKKFMFKNSGVLLENDMIQIGIKSEYKKNFGRLMVFYGNKTTFQIIGFNATVTCPGDLSDALQCQVQPVESVIENNGQLQQLINIECVTEFGDTPVLQVQFILSGNMHNFNIKLPVMLSKFSEATLMDSPTFFQRWKQLNQNQQECQKIFKAIEPIDKASIDQKLIGFGVGSIDNIDPNPDNYVSAAILHTRAQQIGCLLRLEPNTKAEMYRLTVRSTKEVASKTLCELLESQF